jgi:hypothetical protein
VEACSLQQYVKPPAAFCPVHFTDWEKMLQAAVPWGFDDGTHGIHLWNELWRRSGRDKDAVYPDDCLYEQLRRRYLA